VDQQRDNNKYNSDCVSSAGSTQIDHLSTHDNFFLNRKQE